MCVYTYIYIYIERERERERERSRILVTEIRRTQGDRCRHHAVDDRGHVAHLHHQCGGRLRAAPFGRR